MASFPGGEEIWVENLWYQDPEIIPKEFQEWTESKKDKWYGENVQYSPAHCVYLWKGRYYDTHSPKGETDWKELYT